ncbi:MAG: hypothetical protein QG565_416 [Campylobacterota bacterium]|nr:hypothetical protein [Campylobacterota bacterium]
MSTLFNYWHYLVIIIIMLTLLAGILYAFKQKERSLIFPIIFSTTIISVMLAGIGIAVVDKYTKVAKLYKLENKRNLSTEQIMYSGIVKNEGKFEIGEVTFEIKLVNKGHVSGNVKAGTFYSPTGFMSFFGLTEDSGSKKENRPQQITREFVVARNLRPGESQEFRVYFDYPPYFSGVSHFSKVYAH